MMSGGLESTLRTDLEKWLKGYHRTVVLGIGSSLRKDDALGTEILRRLRGKVPSMVKLIDGQTAPERFTRKIKRLKPSHVLLIDAAHFDAQPGEARLFEADEIARVVVSTHAMPLYMLAETLQKDMDVKVALLGVQPRTVDFGEGLSPDAREAAKRIEKILANALKNATRKLG
jgi:hydrogenase maturation protease HycI